VEEKPAFGARRPHKKKTVKRYAGALWGIKALTGMLPACPAFESGEEGSFLKIDYFLTGEPRLKGWGSTSMFYRKRCAFPAVIRWIGPCPSPYCWNPKKAHFVRVALPAPDGNSGPRLQRRRAREALRLVLSSIMGTMSIHGHDPRRFEPAISPGSYRDYARPNRQARSAAPRANFFKFQSTSWTDAGVYANQSGAASGKPSTERKKT